ncbi:Suppressor of Mek1 [Diplonema papillatum]|nr:Suppressor of Mek1 [Diplonema papillatum]
MAELQVRAKLFFLDHGQGKWREQSICNIKVENGVLEASRAADGKVLLSHTLNKYLDYRLEKGVLIAFRDRTPRDEEEDVLLACSSTQGAATLLEEMNKGVEPLEKMAKLPAKEEDTAPPAAAATDLEKELPEKVTYANLEALVEVLEKVEPSGTREAAGQLALRREYVPQILSLFDILDDLDDEDGLNLIYRAVLAMFKLATPALVFRMIHRTTISAIIAALEHHPFRPRIQHRAYFQEVSLSNPMLLEKELTELLTHVHKIFYLRDTVLPLAIDDLTTELLTNEATISRNSAVSWISSENELVKEVVSKVDPRSPNILEILKFVEELLQVLKTLPPGQQPLRRYMENGLLTAVAPCARHANRLVRAACSDIVNECLLLDTSLLRDFAISRDSSLLTCVLDQTVREEDPALQCQWQDVGKILLETKNQREKYVFAGSSKLTELDDSFLELLYNRRGGVLDPLLIPLKWHPDLVQDPSNVPETEKWILAPRRADRALYVSAPLVAICIQGHRAAAAQWAEDHGIIQAAVKLLKSINLKFRNDAVMACVWILRAGVEADDQALHQTMAELDPFGVLMHLTSRRGMLASTFLSVLDAIWSLNRRPLVQLIGDKYGPQLESMKETHMGKHFLLRYQKNQGDHSSPPPTVEQPSGAAPEEHERDGEADLLAGSYADEEMHP